MTQPEFIAWLEGFLDGKLSAEDVAKVKARAAEVSKTLPQIGSPVVPFPRIPDTNPYRLPDWTQTFGCGSLEAPKDLRISVWNEAEGNA